MKSKIPRPIGHYPPTTIQTAESIGTTPPGRLEGALDNLEREIILDALKSARGNMAKAARALGISERIMGLRVKKYNIKPRRLGTEK